MMMNGKPLLVRPDGRVGKTQRGEKGEANRGRVNGVELPIKGAEVSLAVRDEHDREGWCNIVQKDELCKGRSMRR